MARVPEVYAECQDAFEEVFGRRPAEPVEAHSMDDAEIALVSMGTTASTVRRVVDAARKRGIKLGSLRVRMFRPFPEKQLRELLRGCRRVGVLDRDISLGHGGVLWSELRGTVPDGCVVQNYILGLGGGDIRPANIEEVLEDLCERSKADEPKLMEIA
jgi:pyruvate/2-oxoacid:ferredoxin oxidoreductase alpha subunit